MYVFVYEHFFLCLDLCHPVDYVRLRPFSQKHEFEKYGVEDLCVAFDDIFFHLGLKHFRVLYDILTAIFEAGSLQLIITQYDWFITQNHI